jgi:hypothetical protein
MLPMPVPLVLICQLLGETQVIVLVPCLPILRHQRKRILQPGHRVTHKLVEGLLRVEGLGLRVKGFGAPTSL